MTSIGRYIIEAELGTGSMGVVYLAVDPRLERRIALKTYRLPDGVTPEQQAEFKERFLREARAAASLSDPGIVMVYDSEIDSESDVPFIAMELVTGRSLKETLDEEQRLSPERAFAITETVARALQVAHDAGIVHRDVKPANILIRESDGAVKLADFGVARLATSELTRSGASIGSPAYMSPEQVRGKPVDNRSDLFSLAVILYEMLCGERPFGGEELTSIAHAIAYEAPIPITRRVPGLPPGLDAFFDRALAKDPSRRFATGTDFRDGLDAAVRKPAGLDPTATVVEGLPPARPRRRRRWRLGAAAALVVLLGWFLLRGGDAQLRLDGRSSVEGTLSILIDGEEVYSRELAAPQKRNKFLKKVLPKQDQEKFEAWLDVPSGKHEIMAQVEPLGYRNTIVVDFEPGEKRVLRLAAGRTFGTPLSLKVE